MIARTVHTGIAGCRAMIIAAMPPTCGPANELPRMRTTFVLMYPPSGPLSTGNPSPGYATSSGLMRPFGSGWSPYSATEPHSAGPMLLNDTSVFVVSMPPTEITLGTSLGDWCCTGSGWVCRKFPAPPTSSMPAATAWSLIMRQKPRRFPSPGRENDMLKMSAPCSSAYWYASAAPTGRFPAPSTFPPVMRSSITRARGATPVIVPALPSPATIPEVKVPCCRPLLVSRTSGWPAPKS